MTIGQRNTPMTTWKCVVAKPRHKQIMHICNGYFQMIGGLPCQ